jgi:hypothetical protein
MGMEETKKGMEQRAAGLKDRLWRGADATWKEVSAHPVRSLALTGTAVLIFGIEPLAAVAAVAAIGAARLIDQRRHHDVPAT